MDKNRQIDILKHSVADLETKWLNADKRCELLWNSAINAAMDQFGVEHKPRCKKEFCASCNARALLQPLLRDTHVNRKSPRELAKDFVESVRNSDHLRGFPMERKVYVGALKDMFAYLVGKGVM